MKPLFFLGNKRSGTSLMVELLNLHPRVFVTHESDIMWILFQWKDRRSADYACYRWDGPRGMEATLAVCRSMIESNLREAARPEALARTFYDVQCHLMRHRSRRQRTYDKSDLSWIGDKKPVQHADPQIHSFCHALFPEARYLHLVRHPKSVASSMERASRSWDVTPSYWKEGTDAILERWVIQEEWVRRAREGSSAPVHTLRFEDLLEAPVARMEEIFDFLGLDMPVRLGNEIRGLVRPSKDQAQDFELAYPPRVRHVMERYGYEAA